MFLRQRQRFQNTNCIKGNFMSGVSMVINNPPSGGNSEQAFLNIFFFSKAVSVTIMEDSRQGFSGLLKKCWVRRLLWPDPSLCCLKGEMQSREFHGSPVVVTSCGVHWHLSSAPPSLSFIITGFCLYSGHLMCAENSQPLFCNELGDRYFYRVFHRRPGLELGLGYFFRDSGSRL